MEKIFDSKKFIQQLGEELVRSFDNSSSATTPGLVGDARETAILKKLEKLLPPYIGVGTGCVFDSFGNTSKQMDVILYEKDYCPAFSISDSPKATYYPCEGVVAVLEIKSALTKPELKDIFEKSKSVKNLKRYSITEKTEFGWNSASFRSFGNKTSFSGAVDESYNQEEKATDQIYFFAICGENKMAKKTLCDEYFKLLNNYGSYSPNHLINLTDFILFFLKNDNNQNILFNSNIVDSYIEADYCAISEERKNNFDFAITRLLIIIDKARTVPIHAYKRYFVSTEKEFNFYIINQISK